MFLEAVMKILKYNNMRLKDKIAYTLLDLIRNGSRHQIN